MLASPDPRGAQFGDASASTALAMSTLPAMPTMTSAGHVALLLPYDILEFFSVPPQYLTATVDASNATSTSYAINLNSDLIVNNGEKASVAAQVIVNMGDWATKNDSTGSYEYSAKTLSTVYSTPEDDMADGGSPPQVAHSSGDMTLFCPISNLVVSRCNGSDNDAVTISTIGSSVAASTPSPLDGDIEPIASLDLPPSAVNLTWFEATVVNARNTGAAAGQTATSSSGSGGGAGSSTPATGAAASSTSAKSSASRMHGPKLGTSKVLGMLFTSAMLAASWSC